MKPRILFIPLAIISALLFFSVEDAHAHGGRLGPHGARLGPHARSLHGTRSGGVVIGGGISIPLQTRGGYYQEVVEYVGGYNEVRTREVEVPGQQIGWNMRHEPIYAGSRVEIETYEVWIPRQRVVRRVWVPARPVGVITIGGRFRVR